MISRGILIFIPAILAGFGMIHLLWKSHSNNIWIIPLKFFLGIGFGLGITSCLYFFRLVLFPGQNGYLILALSVLGGTIAALLLRRRISFSNPFRGPFFSLLQVIFILGTFFAFYNATIYSLALFRSSPHGDYDAQAIWNFRVRSLYRLGDTWEESFSPEYNRNFHMDYPLLVPMNVLGSWNTLGREVFSTPAIQSMLYLGGISGVLFSTLAYKRTVSQASLASILLLSTPLMILIASSQTADIGIIYYFLSATALLTLFFTEENTQLLYLAGMMAALSAWTKNEGFSFLLLISIIATWMLWKKNRIAQIRHFVFGTILPVTTIVLFKVYLPFNQGNDLFAGNELITILSQLIEPARYSSIFISLLSELTRLGEWHVSIVILLFIYGIIVGFTKYPGDKVMVRWIILIPLSQLAAYLGIYLITPKDLDWHMKYSMNRLLLHLYPIVLMLFFLAVKTPEEIIESA